MVCCTVAQNNFADAHKRAQKESINVFMVQDRLFVFQKDDLLLLLLLLGLVLKCPRSLHT